MVLDMVVLDMVVLDMVALDMVDLDINNTLDMVVLDIVALDMEALVLFFAAIDDVQMKIHTRQDQIKYILTRL